MELSQTNNHEKTLRVELTIAHLLRWGVLLSFVILALGIGAVVITGNTGYHSIGLDNVERIVQYNARPDFPTTLDDVISGLLALKPYAIITFGLLVLIAIPVLRVAISVVAFALEGDWLYVLITALVMAVLILSFVIGETGGRQLVHPSNHGKRSSYVAIPLSCHSIPPRTSMGQPCRVLGRCESK